MTEPREIGAAEFKARCLELMDEVERLGTEIVITKHRKPVARLAPVLSESGKFCGSLAGMIVEEGDLISPIDVTWEADEPNLA
ncbi:MAG TPA: type II toxin-antitoxin system prevent-host-death family antitoxin [Candidatus Tyrphobacter sp.]